MDAYRKSRHANNPVRLKKEKVSLGACEEKTGRISVNGKRVAFA